MNNMRTTLLLLFTYFGIIICQAQSFDWGFSDSLSIDVQQFALDDHGNTYITGRFARDSAYIGHSFIPRYIYNRFGGAWGGFLAKLNDKGELVWAKGLSGGGGIEQHYLAVRDNALYLAGAFEDSIDLDPGPSSDIYYQAIGVMVREDIFLAKYDTLGAYQWGFAFATLEDEDMKGVLIDSLGDVIIAGQTGDVMNFDYDPGPGVTNLLTSGDFIAKYTGLDGSFQWVKPSGVRLEGASKDPTGGFYVYGGSRDGPRILKFNELGTLIDFKVMKRRARYSVTHVTVSHAGDVFVTGQSDDTPNDFNPGSGIDTLFNRPGHRTDAFITKLNPDLTYGWTILMGQKDIHDWAYEVSPTIDDQGDVYIPITFYDTLYVYNNTTIFDTLFPQSDWRDSYIGKFDTKGNYLGATLLKNSRTISMRSLGKEFMYHFIQPQASAPLYHFTDSCERSLPSNDLLVFRTCQPSCVSQISNDQTIPIGGQLSLSISTSGSPINSYQWKKDGQILLDNSTISGAQTDTLRIDPYVEADSGAYTCEIISSCSGLLESGPTKVSSGWALSRNKNSLLKGVEIYPNPANDLLNISVSSELNSQNHLLIYDLFGQKIQEVSFVDQIQISLSEFSSGIYLISIQNESQFYHGSVLKK